MIPFTKAHACGNDFLVVEQGDVPEARREETARLLCKRSTGMGADGVEYFEWLGDLTGRIRLHNADGSVAEISGNGTRCVAAWMASKLGAKAGAELRIETDAGWRECRVIRASESFYEIVSGMGRPVLEKSTLTLVDGAIVAGTIVNTGNPHFVIRVENAKFEVGGRAWQSVGEEICVHKRFPKQTNVEFVHVLSDREVEIRIFERGVGPTNSSGTGTCASASAAISLHGCRSPLRVVAPGGAQTVEWDGVGSEMFLTGPAVLVAAGSAFLPLDGDA